MDRALPGESSTVLAPPPLSLKNSSSAWLPLVTDAPFALEKKLRMLAFGFVLPLPFANGFFFEPDMRVGGAAGVVAVIKYGELSCVIELSLLNGGVGGRPTTSFTAASSLGLRNILILSENDLHETSPPSGEFRVTLSWL